MVGKLIAIVAASVVLVVLMQAMGPNVSGVIGSAVVAGILYTLCR